MGTPLPSALAMVTTSGTHAEVLVAEPRAAAAEAGLDLVDHEEDAALVAEPADALEVLGRRRVHAALALHRLEQHRGHRRVEGRLERVEVVPGDVPEALGQRLERLVLGGLAGGVERGEGAAVERAEGAHDDVAAPAAELAGQLEGALVGLGAGVGEEHLAARAVGGQPGWPTPSRRSSVHATCQPARCRRGWTRAAASGPARAARRPPPGGCGRGR